MDREAVEGLRLGTVLLIISATLVIGSIIFWWARLYTGSYIDKAAIQNQRVQTLELESISTQGIVDLPVASIYTVVSREWHAVTEISVFDMSGSIITIAKLTDKDWILTPSIKKPDGTTVVSKLSGPEQVLYTIAGGVYNNKLSGRALVTATENSSSSTYSIQVKLEQ